MRVNELFCSLQGEGWYTGVAAVFVRLSGCNLRCAFCDTDHERGEAMTVDQIVAAVGRFAPIRHVVLTGGEPTLQPIAPLVCALSRAGYYVQMETNGTRPIADSAALEVISWITCSPKMEFCPDADVRIERIDELKVVYDGTNRMDLYAAPTFDNVRVRSLQPCDTGDAAANRRITEAATAYCMAHPEWRLSLQTHKMLGIR